MPGIESISLADVQAVYSGPEKDLWELIMGEQIHIGGLQSSIDLADKAGISEDMSGCDLCCCTGAGMRFLVRLQRVAAMTGVDATERVIVEGRQRCEVAGAGDRITFIQADACETGLASNSFDFVWGEDAWVYVVDKPALIKEAVRIVKPGGTIAFTDWVEGPAGLSEEERERFCRFMKFHDIESIPGYSALLEQNGCAVRTAENTGRFAAYVELYLKMVSMQFTYDVLRILDFNEKALDSIAEEMAFMYQLACEEKIVQGMFTAIKNE